MSTHNENSESLLNAGVLSITTANASQSVFADVKRNYLLIQNVSDADMYLGIGFIPTVGGGILLKASGGGFSAEGEFVPKGAVNIVCAGAGKAFVALQG